MADFHFPYTNYTDARGVKWLIVTVQPSAATMGLPNVLAHVDERSDLVYVEEPPGALTGWSGKDDDVVQTMARLRAQMDEQAAKAGDLRRQVIVTAHPDAPGVPWWVWAGLAFLVLKSRR